MRSFDDPVTLAAEGAADCGLVVVVAVACVITTTDRVVVVYRLCLEEHLGGNAIAQNP